MKKKIRKAIIYVTKKNSEKVSEKVMTLVNGTIDCGIYDVLIVDASCHDPYQMDLSFFSTNINRVCYKNYDLMVESLRQFVGSDAVAIAFDDIYIAHDKMTAFCQLVRQFNTCQRSITSVQKIDSKYGVYCDDDQHQCLMEIETLGRYSPIMNFGTTGHYILTEGLFNQIQFRSQKDFEGLVVETLNAYGENMCGILLEGELRYFDDDQKVNIFK